MVIEINNKTYRVVFNFAFVKHVIKVKKFKGFPEYEKYLSQFVFDETTFSPEHLEMFAELLLFGINADKDQNLKMTLEEVADIFWQDMSLLAELTEHFIASQPKANKVVDPATRNLGKQKKK